MNEERIERATAYIRELFRDSAGSHDADHTLRVCHNALRLADREPSCDREIVVLAALLHDVDDHKLFSTENNANARAFLTAEGIPADRIEQICEAVNSVSFSRNRGRRPETLEAQIVQDADRLDAIGAIGIGRAFAFGGEHGRSLADTIGHFHDKLLLLQDLMNTDAGRKLALSRHAFLEAFLRQWDEETHA